MMARSALCVLALGIGLGCASKPPSPAPRPSEAPVTAQHFFNFRLIHSDGSAVENAGMIADGGTITAIGESATVAAQAGGARAIDLGGVTIMPLVHSLPVHPGYTQGTSLAAAHYSRASILADLRRYAHYGVGSVLTLGSDAGDTALMLRAEQRQGLAEGARLFTAGRGITATNGWPTHVPVFADLPHQVATAEQGRAAVRALAESGVDVVKIWLDDGGGRVAKIPPAVYQAVIDEANARDLPVYAHVFYLEDARKLVAAGVSCLAHSIRDVDVDDAFIAMMKARDVLYVPTLVAHELALAHADEAQWIGEPAMRETVSADVIALVKSEAFVANARKNPQLSALREQYAVAQRNLIKLHDAGVRIGLGADSGLLHRYPGYFEHRELELMVQAGMSAQDAIRAGTGTAARALGIAGELTEGAPASFIALQNNPLANIINTRQIKAVYIRGAPIQRLSPPDASGTVSAEF